MNAVLHFSAPGRTEICGNHTDHQHGCVLAAAVDLETCAEATPRDDGIVRVRSEGYAPVEIQLRDLAAREDERGTSAALVRGVAAGIAGGVADIGGMRAAVETRDVERPVVFLLQRGGAAADGAFLQFDFFVKFHRSSCAALYKRDKGGTAKPVRRARSARKGRRRMEMLLSFYYSGSAPKLE